MKREEGREKMEERRGERDEKRWKRQVVKEEGGRKRGRGNFIEIKCTGWICYSQFIDDIK